MSTTETTKAKELANQIRTLLDNVTLKTAELSNLGFTVAIRAHSTGKLELVATRTEEIQL